MKKILLFAFIIISFTTYCQDYRHALGFRTGTTSGMTYKHFANDENALEAILSFEREGLQLTLLREYHQPMFLEISDKLFFYYGIGGHIGYTRIGTETVTMNNKSYVLKEFSFGIGIDGVLGIEYHLIKYPFTICVDYKPMAEYNFRNYYRSRNFDFSFTFLYTF